jgi:hypothetical protein
MVTAQLISRLLADRNGDERSEPLVQFKLAEIGLDLQEPVTLDAKVDAAVPFFLGDPAAIHLRMERASRSTASCWSAIACTRNHAVWPQTRLTSNSQPCEVSSHESAAAGLLTRNSLLESAE